MLPKESDPARLGSSGYNSTFDANHRWTDYLAQRLNAAPPSQRKSIVNEGIGGNEILKDRACCGSQISARAIGP